MGVIIDSGVKNYIEQLEAKGSFSLAGAFRKANEISLSALATMTFIPPEYQALVENSVAFQVLKNHQEERSKREERERKHAADLAMLHQLEIDNNVLHLSVNGQELDISQGDLRKAMKQRVEELEEERKQLLKKGGDPKELRRINNLLDEYEPVIDDLQNHKADPSTMNAVQDLLKKDPPLAVRIQSQWNDNAHITADKTISKENALTSTDPSTNAPTNLILKDQFAKGASPQIQTSAPTTSQLENRLRKLDSTVQGLGI